MSIVYRCERCGKIMEYIEKDISGTILHATLKTGWYPKEIQICNNCATSLRKFLEDWWNKQDEQK